MSMPTIGVSNAPEFAGELISADPRTESKTSSRWAFRTKARVERLNLHSQVASALFETTNGARVGGADAARINCSVSGAAGGDGGCRLGYVV